MLRVAVIVDGEVCEEHCPRAPADLFVGRTPSSRALMVYDGRPDACAAGRARWLALGLSIGLIVAIGGASSFVHELGQRASVAELVDAERGDMPAFELREHADSGGLGFLLVLLGLVPTVAGGVGLREHRVAPGEVQAPEGRAAPRRHRLFRWHADRCVYTLALPPGARAQLELDEGPVAVASGHELDACARGRVFLAQTTLAFAAQPRPEPIVPTLDLDLDPVERPGRAKFSGLDRVSLAAALGVGVLVAVWSSSNASRGESPAPERLVREMGLPTAYYHRPGPGGPVRAPARAAPLPPIEPRGVGVARVISWYGDPAAPVFDPNDYDEATLSELFDAGMGPAPAELDELDAELGELDGELDLVAAAATIRRRLPGLAACYRKHGGAGAMTFTIAISTQSRVTEVEIIEDPFDDARLRGCVTAKIKSWRFVRDAPTNPAHLTFTVRSRGPSAREQVAAGAGSP